MLNLTYLVPNSYYKNTRKYNKYSQHEYLA